MSLAGQRADASRYQVIPRALVFGIRREGVLLQRVAADRGAWAGLWNGPGGHIHQGESPEAAARREFAEETGLTLTDPRLAGVVLVDVGGSPGIGVFVFVGGVSEGDPQAGPEGELAWFKPGEAAAAPTVADVPAILGRAMAVLDGAPPFTARTTFAADGSPLLRFD